MRASLPNEVTGSGLSKRRGWKWWLSRQITWFVFLLLRAGKHGKLVMEKVKGIPIVVLPGVFHPKLFLSTPLLIDALEQLSLKPNASVLDLGTGTGICAIFAALKGGEVTATDISPLAVRCTRVNVALNDLEDRVSVLEGDLFQPVKEGRFDLVIFNPPFYKGKPRDWPEYAWRGEDVLHRFVNDLNAHLEKGGCALLSVSTELDLSAIKDELQANGFDIHEIGKRRIPGETMSVYMCVPFSLSRVSRKGELESDQ